MLPDSGSSVLSVSDEFSETDEDAKARLKLMLRRKVSGESPPIIEVFEPDEEFKINDEVVLAVEKFGYPKEYIRNCIKNIESNYCTMAFYLLQME